MLVRVSIFPEVLKFILESISYTSPMVFRMDAAKDAENILNILIF